MSSELKRQIEEVRDFIQKNCAKDPAMFSKAIAGQKLQQYQKDIINSVWNYKHTAVASCNSSGKSFLAGNLAITFYQCFPKSFTLTTAPTARQVEKLVWKEIRASYRKATKRLQKAGFDEKIAISMLGNLRPSAPYLDLEGDEWCIMGMATNDPDRLVGFHSDYILAIIDEAAGVKEDIYSTISDGILSSGKKPRSLLIGNPTNSSGMFYNIFKNPPPQTNLIYISCFDTPNFTTYELTLEDFLEEGKWLRKMGLSQKEIDIYYDISHPKYLEVMAKFENLIPFSYLHRPDNCNIVLSKYGLDSTIFRARCLGKFPLEGMDSLVPISWIETSNENWKEADCLNIKGLKVLGVDVANKGADKSIFCFRTGNYVEKFKVFEQNNSVDLSDEIEREHIKYNFDHIVIDCDGLGIGVYDICNSRGLPVFEFKGSKTSKDPQYHRARTESWFNIRNLLNPDERLNKNPILIPPDDDIAFELSSVRWDLRNGEKILEDKKAFKTRLKRSPDKSDALAYAFYVDSEGRNPFRIDTDFEIWTYRN